MEMYLREVLNLEEYDGLIIPMYEESLQIEGIELPIQQLKESEKFRGKSKEIYRFTSCNESIKEVVLVGLGSKDELSYKNLLNVLADSYRTLKREKVKNIAIVFDKGNVEATEKLVSASVESVTMASYKFDKYKTSEAKENPQVSIIANEVEKYENIRKESSIIATSNLVARRLVDEPANILNPKTLSKEVEALGKEKGFEVEVLKHKEIEELGMESFLAVAKGSDIHPRFIIMRYNGNPDSEEILGYVGKGLTYDSGGLSIKPTSGMVDMKGDMAGAAAVIGAMCAIAEAKLEVNVVAVVAACENMISGNSYRPGDIINSMGGKTIFIGNTDAEGRLTLIDAMHYIVTKESVTKVLDIATLTGAAIHCTGSAASVAISNDDKFYEEVREGFDLSGEQIWRMPIFDEYKELIKHHDADLTNTAGSPGTITAGLFVGEFNGGLPWTHIDIAGTSYSKKEKGIFSKGATGIAVRSLYHLAKN